jgi:hypothetical protein
MPGARNDSVLSDDEQVIGVIPKSARTEQRVLTKIFSARKNAKPGRYVDIREFWYRDGVTEPPVHGRKGIMIVRDNISKLIEILLTGLEPEDFTDEDLDKYQEAIDSLRDRKVNAVDV